MTTTSVKPGELDLPNKWLQMGVELEGSWTSSRKAVAAKVRGAKPIDDRSVHIGHGDPGEIVTRPHDSLDALCEDVLVLWPESVNDSCGFHIHASFTPLNASLIATRSFYDYFKESWNEWGIRMKLPRNHEFWNRLAGKNKFAKDVFNPDEQLKGFRGAPQNDRRYSILNFFAWEKHRTIECRLLPMFTDKEIGVSAIRHMSAVYNKYLGSHTFEPLTFESSVDVVGEVVEETYVRESPVLEPLTYETESISPTVPVGDDIFYSISGAMDKMVRANKDNLVLKDVVSP